MASKLKLQVDVDVTGAQKLQGLGGGLQRTGANLTKYVTLPLLTAAGAAAGLALTAQKSTDRLNAAFKSMGDTSGKTLEELNAQADALGEATVFDDEGIRDAQANLITFGTVSGESFDRAIEAAANWAAFSGKEVPDAAQILGRSLADPADALGRLSRMGIVFTDSQQEAIRAMVESGDTLGAQNAILEAFEERFGGVNQVMQDSPAGQTAQALEDLANAGEDIGAFLLPPLATLARFLSDLARAFTSLDPGVQGFIVGIGAVVAAIGPAIFIGGKLIGAFKAVGVAFNALKLLMLTNPFTALALAVAAIAALIILNWDKISKFLGEVWDKIAGGVKTLGNMLEGAWKRIQQTVTAVWDAVVGIIKGAINGVIDVINGFFGFLNGIQIGIPSIDVGPVHVGGGTIDPFNIPLIPRLAEGGIVDGATLALIGEKGPEAVVPLDKLQGATEFHSHIEVRGEEPFIRNVADLNRAQQRLMFLEGF